MLEQSGAGQSKAMATNKGHTRKLSELLSIIASTETRFPVRARFSSFLSPHRTVGLGASGGRACVHCSLFARSPTRPRSFPEDPPPKWPTQKKTSLRERNRERLGRLKTRRTFTKR